MDKRIEEIRDEGDCFFVYLKPGFGFSTPVQHCFGAEDRKEIRATMARVKKCACPECMQLLAKAFLR